MGHAGLQRLVILMVDEGATKEQVYSTLRRLAMVLHAKGDGAKFDDKRF